MWQFLIDIMPYAIMNTIPMFIVALGGLASERSGIVNIALEGLMTVGCFTCAIFIFLNGNNTMNIWLSILLAGVATSIFSLLHAYASVTLSANQVISGTALNMIAPALTIFLSRYITGSQNINIGGGLPRFDIPILSKIPFVGPLLFSKYYSTTGVMLLLSVLVWYLIFKTKFGLRLRACGENPHAADSVGINVSKMRYVGVLLSGFLAGIGGAVYIVSGTGEFNGSVAGTGFLALGALIFGKWKVFNVLGATLFFGFMKTLGNVAMVNETLKQFKFPTEFYNALPYVMTIIALILFSKNTVGPKAAGEIYDKGKR